MGPFMQIISIQLSIVLTTTTTLYKASLSSPNIEEAFHKLY